MPSPFPGMDPYLERPWSWPSVHSALIAEIKGVLNLGLRPNYVARSEDRVYVCGASDPARCVIIPDLTLSAPGRKGKRLRKGDSSVAIAEPIEAITCLVDEIREHRIELIEVSQRRVVTVIEVLSPTNKVPGSEGRESFQKKRNEVLGSPVHWVEIDLLREGDRFLTNDILCDTDYFVHVSRANRRPRGSVWRIALAEQLPIIGIPLTGDVETFKVDLQAIVTEVYDTDSYDLTIDYKQGPNPPLKPAAAKWANAPLKKAGAR